MRVKNKYTSHLGFGTVRILPDEVKPLPKGYSLEHPVVKFYISKGWLEVIDKKVGDNDAQSGDNGQSGNVEASEDNGKSIDRMNKEELQALASERGIEFADTDTKATLIEKIKATQAGNE